MTRDPWAQQIGESRAAFAAFMVYRDQPGRRSARAVAEALGKSESLIWRWAARHAWQARATQYDAELDRRARRANEKAVLDFRARAAQQSRAAAQVLSLPAMAISARIEAARGAGQDLLSMFEGVSLHDLVFLGVHAGRVLPGLLKAEANALGVAAVPEGWPEVSRPPDVLTERIAASDELRSLAAVLIERASMSVDVDRADDVADSRLARVNEPR